MRDPEKNIIVPHGAIQRQLLLKKWVDRFVKEALFLHQIHHTSIVPVRLVWRERGTAFYAMNYVKGGQLRSPTQQNWKAISWAEAEQLVFDLFDALEAVHDAGLIHGDIKAENILLTKKGKPVLIDFGTARNLIDFKSTLSANTHAYTPGYAPPELHGTEHTKSVGEWSDLYSLAMVIVGLLSRHPQTKDGGPMNVVSRYQSLAMGPDPYSDLSHLLPKTPSHVRKVLQQCLLLDFRKRPRSVANIRNLFVSKPIEIASGSIENARLKRQLQQTQTRNSAQKAELKRVSDQKTKFDLRYRQVLAQRNKFEHELRRLLSQKNEFEQKLEQAKQKASLQINSLEQRLEQVTAELNDLKRKSQRSGQTAYNRRKPFEANKSNRRKPQVINGFAQLPPGSFFMGSAEREKGRFTTEKRHEVVLTRSFFMKTTAVTQAEWQALMKTNPSYFTGEKQPVENVNWFEACAYANALSRKEGLKECYRLRNPKGTPGENGFSCSRVQMIRTCKGYRLPTEAEWEYAARAGTTTPFYAKNPDSIAWTSSNSNGVPHAVAKKDPNKWGLYDMSGNVWEWCWDWFQAAYVGQTDPFGPETGNYRVRRGGAHSEEVLRSRSAQRYGSPPSTQRHFIGFRLVRSL